MSMRRPRMRALNAARGHSPVCAACPGQRRLQQRRARREAPAALPCGGAARVRAPFRGTCRPNAPVSASIACTLPSTRPTSTVPPWAAPATRVGARCSASGAPSALSDVPAASSSSSARRSGAPGARPKARMRAGTRRGVLQRYRRINRGTAWTREPAPPPPREMASSGGRSLFLGGDFSSSVTLAASSVTLDSTIREFGAREFDVRQRTSCVFVTLYLACVCFAGSLCVAILFV